jgi:uncharacterized protein (UPF0179 family)
MRFAYIFMALFLIGMVNAFTIVSPEATITYNTNDILLSMEHNETLDSMSYGLDDVNFTACTNCSVFNTTLNAGEGTHIIRATGILGNETVEKYVVFIVDILPVFSLDINDPEAKVYDTNIVDFDVESDMALRRIYYFLDNSSEINACDNCSKFNTTLNLTEGTHTLKVRGLLGNDVIERQVIFTVDTVPEFSLDIKDPKAKIYNTNIIDFDIKSDIVLEKIYYFLDNSSKIDACTNCSKFNTTLNLTEGTHKLITFGTSENITKNDSVEFEINVADSFDLDVKSPEAKTYYDENISILVESNTTLDMMRLEIGELIWTCTNCSKINETVELDLGNYSLKAKGFVDDWTKTVFVDFKIMEKIKYNDTNDTKTYSNESRFTIGLEKLPKMVANGELTDVELAQIIRDNKLNPGVLNRLIKTGKLGNESINAILDTQSKPQGIFWKLIGKIGIKQKTYSSIIADNYNLTDDTKEKIVVREDLPKKNKEKITNEIKASNNGSLPPGLEKKLSNTESHSKVPPGQAKKLVGSFDNGSNSKIPPGQAKKNK